MFNRGFIAGPRDPYWANVELLLQPRTEADGSTSFTDLSDFNRTLVAKGNVQIDTAQSKFYGRSVLGDGSGDFIQTPDDNRLDFGSDNFCIEGWIRPDVASGEQHLFGKRSGFGESSPILLGIKNVSGNNRLYIIGSTIGGSSWNINGGFGTGSINIPTGAWTHIAVAREGSSFRGFVNGTLDVTYSRSGSLAAQSDDATIGASAVSGENAFDGHFGPVRITRGVARYTASFPIPTDPFPTRG